MPGIRLIQAEPVACEDLEDEVRVDGIGCPPAVGHGAGVERVGVDEDNEASSESEVAGIGAVVIAQICQIRGQLRDRRITLAFGLVVDRPPEPGSGGCREQRGNASVGLRALAPPRRDPGLDVPVLHRLDLLLEDRRIASVVVPERRVVARVRVHPPLRPRLGEPRIVESCADREAELDLGTRARRRRQRRLRRAVPSRVVAVDRENVARATTKVQEGVRRQLRLVDQRPVAIDVVPGYAHVVRRGRPRKRLTRARCRCHCEVSGHCRRL